MGSGSHRWATHRLLGSVSTAILHEAPCSVIVVHEFDRERPGMRRVLVAVDGSETATATVQAAIGMLDPAKVEIQVASVAATAVALAIPVPMAAPLPTYDVQRRVEEQELVRAKQDVARAAEEFRAAGFKVTTRVLRGAAAAEILEAATDSEADLVVVGSRGMGAVRRVLLGSVSDQVARLAPAALVGRFPNG